MIALTPTVQTLYVDAAGKLLFRFPEGRPTAATLSIVQKDGSALTTAVTDTNIITYIADPNISTTLSVAASRYDETITLTAVSGAGVTFYPEESYIIDGGTAYAEWVRVKAINTSTKVVTLYEPLERDHANAAAFQSTTLYYTVTTGNNDEVMSSVKATVTYTMAGVTGLKRTWLYDVKYHKWQSTLTADRLRRILPMASSWGYTEQKGWDAQIEEGADLLREEMLAREYDLDNLINDREAERAHLMATISLIYDMWTIKDPAMVETREIARKNFEAACDNLKSNARWYERGDQDGTLSTGSDDGEDDESRRYAVKMVLA